MRLRHLGPMAPAPLGRKALRESMGHVPVVGTVISHRQAGRQADRQMGEPDYLGTCLCESACLIAVALTVKFQQNALATTLAGQPL